MTKTMKVWLAALSGMMLILIPMLMPSAVHAADRTFGGFHTGLSAGVQNIFAGSDVGGIDMRARHTGLVGELTLGLRHQFKGGLVVGAEVAGGLIDGNLSLDEPGLAIDFNGSSQISYGLQIGYAVAPKWLLYLYGMQTDRSFDVVITQAAGSFEQRDKQGILRYGLGVERRFADRWSLRLAAGLGRADIGDRPTNIGVNNRPDLMIGLIHHF